MYPYQELLFQVFRFFRDLECSLLDPSPKNYFAIILMYLKAKSQFNSLFKIIAFFTPEILPLFFQVFRFQVASRRIFLDRNPI